MKNVFDSYVFIKVVIRAMLAGRYIGLKFHAVIRVLFIVIDW